MDVFPSFLFVMKNRNDTIKSESPVHTKGRGIFVFIEPMLAHQSDQPFDDEYIAEPKMDGFNALRE
jgi:hypothetical protein